MESEIIDEETQLQWKKGALEFERTGLNYLQATSSAVQKKQISSYTSYKQSTSKFATSTKKELASFWNSPRTIEEMVRNWGDHMRYDIHHVINW